MSYRAWWRWCLIWRWQECILQWRMSVHQCCMTYAWAWCLLLCRNWDKCSVATCRNSVQLRLSLSALCSSGILGRTLKICSILAPQESGLSSELWLRMDSPRPHAWCNADCYQCFFGAPLRSRSGNDLCLSLHRRASTSHSVSRPNPKCIQYLFRLPNTCRKVLATFPEGEPTTFHFWMQSQSLELFQHAL